MKSKKRKSNTKKKKIKEKKDKEKVDITFNENLNRIKYFKHHVLNDHI